jgi:membrane-associated HD superfamily phosphohydrolase
MDILSSLPLLPHYPNAFQNIAICLAVVFFVTFLLAVVFGKTAAAEDAYRPTNRLHFRIGVLYCATAVAFAIVKGYTDYEAALGLLTGLYIYGTLHYVFVFPLIGLVRKSISVEILSTIGSVSSSGADRDAVVRKMTLAGTGVSDLRKNRLLQMCLLKLARNDHGDFRISARGKFVHVTGECVLQLFRLKRL